VQGSSVNLAVLLSYCLILRHCRHSWFAFCVAVEAPRTQTYVLHNGCVIVNHWKAQIFLLSRCHCLDLHLYYCIIIYSFMFTFITHLFTHNGICTVLFYFVLYMAVRPLAAKLIIKLDLTWGRASVQYNFALAREGVLDDMS